MNQIIIIGFVLLIVSLAVPGFGRNYSLHSPKIWTQEEKELYDKANEQPEKEQEVVKKELEPIRIHKDKRQAKKGKIPVKKQTVQIKSDEIQVENGVSFREVIVKKGETLYGISLKFREAGVTYSEVLRFNDISEPDRIAVGDIVKIPLNSARTAKNPKPPKQKKTAAVTLPQQAEAVPATLTADGPSLRDVTTPDPPTDELPGPEELAKPPRSAEKAIITAPPLQPPPVSTKRQAFSFTNISAAGNSLYSQAVRAYRRNDCQTAVQLFGRFLVENKDSKLAADVTVFIADCYMKLSGK